jgi:hypothetical protein
LAQSKVALVNLALVKIGAKRISSFTENTPEARAVNAIYDDIRDEVLTEHLWSFAQKRAVLATLSTTPVMTEDGMTIVYAKPSDFLKLNFVSDSNAIVKVEQDGILSDTTGLKIIYTARIDDPTKYFPQFVSALACRLAVELCYNLIESATKAQALMEEYEKIKLPRAIAIDSQQGTPISARMDEWELARNVGVGFETHRPGEATWHPF